MPAVRKEDFDARSPKTPDATKGYIVVDENTTNNQLLNAVIPEDKQKDTSTYILFEKLVDDFNIRNSDKEADKKGNEDVENFINGIKDTAPMQLVAKELFELDGQENATKWFDKIEQLWFSFALNDKQRTGFEHILLGEDKGKNTTQLGGYHFWYKYWKDQDFMEFKGVNYGEGRLNAEGKKTPDVVTLKMDWDAFKTPDNESDDLMKGKGGFWVGCSPEGLIALGMAAFKTVQVRRNPIDIVMNNVEYEIFLYSKTITQGENINEKMIDTFFPVLKKVVGEIPIPAFVDSAEGAEGRGIKIIGALVDVQGRLEAGNETVTLKNTFLSTKILDGWELSDRSGRGFSFTITLGAGAEETITLPPGNDAPKLGNKGGTIVLKDGTKEEQHRVTYVGRDINRQDGTVKFD